MIFTDQTVLQKFLASSGSALQLNLTNATEVQSGYYETFRIDAGEVVYTAYAPSLGSPGEIEVGFTARLNYNTNSAASVIFTLVNSHPAY
jgi:hypothetical protein